MKSIFVSLFLALATVTFGAPDRIALKGTVTNTSGEVSASATLDVVRDGGKVTAQLVTMKPLSGTGPLTGESKGAWVVLAGELEGFRLTFTGVLNSTGYRGTYTAKPEHGLAQYGRFDFAPVKTGS